MPDFTAHNVSREIDALPEMDFHEVARFCEGHVGIYWANAGTSPWERHPDVEELLHIIEGEAEIEVLTGAGPVRTAVGPGSIMVVPRNHWHRHHLLTRVKELYVTPGPSDTSFADDPRAE